MSGEIPRPMGLILRATALLLWGVGMGVTAGAADADDCLVAPNSHAPEGSHWYYHMDQANQRKCWYLHATDQLAQHSAAQRTSVTAAPAVTTAVEKPATDSSAPTTIEPGEGTAVPSPRVKPQRALVSPATTAEPAQRSGQRRGPAPLPATASASAAMPIASDDGAAPPLRGSVQSAPMGRATRDQVVEPSQNESAVSSIVNPLAAQLSPSPQINDRGVTAPPAATPAWPNPPTGVDKTQEPTAPLSEAQSEAVQPTKDTKATNNVEGAAQAGTPTTHTGVAASLTSTPVAIFPVAALGLVVAGFLLRIVVKIFVGRRHQIAVDHHDVDHDDSNRIDDPYVHDPPDDQIVDQRDGLTNCLQRSGRAVGPKSGPHRPSQVSDERLNDVPDTAPLRMDRISKRERRPIGIELYESERMDNKRRPKWRNDKQRRESPSIDPREPSLIDVKRHQRKWSNDGQSPGINARESDRINDRHQQGRRDDQHQHGSVDARDELIDDLQSSLLGAAPTDCRPALPLQEDSSNDGGARYAGSSIREHEEALQQLRRSLDRLLQSPNAA
jgi:hypothetical protein